MKLDKDSLYRCPVCLNEYESSESVACHRILRNDEAMKLRIESALREDRAQSQQLVRDYQRIVKKALGEIRKHGLIADHGDLVEDFKWVLKKSRDDSKPRSKNLTEWRVLNGNMIYAGDKFVAHTGAPRCARTICAAHNQEAF